MSEHLEDVQRYVPDADEDVVKAIVKHLGIALQSKDASLVSASDKTELDRVRESWLKKKLALEHSDDHLDEAIAAVATKMKGDHNKKRVTFYYLLSEHFEKHEQLK